jgi:hypothetical protein
MTERLGLVAAARRAGVSPQALWKAARMNRLASEAGADGRKLRFRIEEIDRYRESVTARRSGLSRTTTASRSTAVPGVDSTGSRRGSQGAPGASPARQGEGDLALDGPTQVAVARSSVERLNLELRALVLEAQISGARRHLVRQALLDRAAGAERTAGRDLREAIVEAVSLAGDDELADPWRVEQLFARAHAAARHRACLRQERLSCILAAVAAALLGAGWLPQAVALAMPAVEDAVSQLDDRLLAGALWPAHVGRMAAHRWAGMPDPAVPWILTIVGPRPIRPGD